MDTDQSSTFLSSIQSEIAKYQLLIEEENQKLKRYKVGLPSVLLLYFITKIAAELCTVPPDLNNLSFVGFMCVFTD